MGPYTVSFDMNTNMNYRIQTPNPAIYPSATKYPLIIATDNATSASISVTQYNNLTDSNSAGERGDDSPSHGIEGH